MVLGNSVRPIFCAACAEIQSDVVSAQLAQNGRASDKLGVGCPTTGQIMDICPRSGRIGSAGPDTCVTERGAAGQGWRHTREVEASDDTRRWKCGAGRDLSLDFALRREGVVHRVERRAESVLVDARGGDRADRLAVLCVCGDEQPHPSGVGGWDDTARGMVEADAYRVREMDQSPAGPDRGRVRQGSEHDRLSGGGGGPSHRVHPSQSGACRGRITRE